MLEVSLNLYLHSALTIINAALFTAQRVTNETFRWVSDARFHPTESKVIATKWYTSSRSLGAGEGWEFPVPSLQQLRELQSTSSSGYAVQQGSGTRLIGRTLPPGWDAATQYGDQQIGPEQVIWASAGDGLIFSKNVIDQDTFQYSKGTRSMLPSRTCFDTQFTRSQMYTKASTRYLSKISLQIRRKSLSVLTLAELVGLNSREMARLSRLCDESEIKRRWF